jgi:DNA-directed RNA polymerase specialized sigma24 family protein
MDGNVPNRPDLSREEKELLRLRRMSTRELAEELKLNERTVEKLIIPRLRRLGRGPDIGEPPGPDD